MRYLKLIFISIIVLSLLITGLSLLFPPHLHIARNINISATREKIDSVIRDMNSWPQWNHFLDDSLLTNKHILPDSNAMVLVSDQVTVTEKRDSLGGILLLWKQPGGKEFTGGFKFMKLHEDEMTVQWYFDFTFRWYPWEKFSSLLYDKQMQPIIEKSLADLKRLVENNP
jgi:hypothetical protein